MIKRYCDMCDVEMKEDDRGPRTALGRLTATLDRGKSKLTVEVIQSRNGVSNSGDFCNHCVLDALKELDDRPKASDNLLSESRSLPSTVTDDMVTRFLGWKLPDNFAPDCGITFTPVRNEHMPWGGNKNEPTGTNLLTAEQARDMLEQVLNA